MRFILASILFFSFQQAQAHVAVGDYQGKDQDGKVCAFTVGEQWFENNQPHPLNERIPVKGIRLEGVALAKADWQVGHPAVVRAEQSEVRFNHDLFQEVSPEKTGAAVLILLKDPEESENGHRPLGIHYISDNYRDKTKTKSIRCML
jgi:hypothetical protein